MSEQSGHAKDDMHWIRLAQMKVKRENGELFKENKNNNNDDNVEHDSYDAAPNGKVCTGVEIGYGSNQQQKIISPRINKIAITTMLMSEAPRTLNVIVGINSAEIRSNYKMLARKYDPDKCCYRRVFTRKENEDIFKKISNACHFLI